MATTVELNKDVRDVIMFEGLDFLRKIERTDS